MIVEICKSAKRLYDNLVEGVQYLINPEPFDEKILEASRIVDDLRHQLRISRWESGLPPGTGENGDSLDTKLMNSD